jgi:hypothetical protein
MTTKVKSRERGGRTRSRIRMNEVSGNKNGKRETGDSLRTLTAIHVSRAPSSSYHQHPSDKGDGWLEGWLGEDARFCPRPNVAVRGYKGLASTNDGQVDGLRIPPNQTRHRTQHYDCFAHGESARALPV